MAIVEKSSVTSLTGPYREPVQAVAYHLGFEILRVQRVIASEDVRDFVLGILRDSYQRGIKFLFLFASLIRN